EECVGVFAAVGLSAARLIVALTSRPAAATAVRRGSVRIRLDTTRASERSNMLITPLMGEVDDVGAESGASRRGERCRGGGLGLAGDRRAEDPPRAVVPGREPGLTEAVDLDVRSGVRSVDEVPEADVDPDVVESVEEDEVAGLQLVLRDRDGTRV